MSHTLFRDALFLMLLGLVALVIWMLPFLNPPAQQDRAEPPGNLIVHITWPEGDTDVDLWSDGPGEPVPVGYSNKSGVLWNLLRDDLGQFPDATPLNYENAYTRGIVPGDYTINVHCYRCPVTPVPVDVEISVKPTGSLGAKTPMRILVTTRVALESEGQERTAIRFRLNADGTADKESFNSVFRPLRAVKKDGGQWGTH